MHIPLLVIALQIPVCIYAQNQVTKYPVRFTQYLNCYSFLNPANTCQHTDYELAFGSQQMFGAVSHVSASYFSMAMRIRAGNRAEPFSAVSIFLYNNREGKYLNRTRFYTSYAWHTSLSNRLRFAAGLSVGGMNYSVKGTPLSGNGSDIKADGSVGFSFYYDLFRIDVSVGQVFNSKVQPLEEVTVLAPMMNITALRKFSIDEEYLLTPSFTARIPFQKDYLGNRDPLLDINLMMEFLRRFVISAGIHDNTMALVSAGISRLQIGQGEFGFMISYAFPVLRTSKLKTSFGEIGINYFF